MRTFLRSFLFAVLLSMFLFQHFSNSKIIPEKKNHSKGSSFTNKCLRKEQNYSFARTGSRCSVQPFKKQITKRQIIFDGTGVVKLVLGISYPFQIDIKNGMLSCFYNIQMQYVPANRPIYWWSFHNTSTFASRFEKKILFENKFYFDNGRKIVYSIIENFLKRYGIDPSCLLRAICNIAKRPFEVTNTRFSIYEHILNLILSPTMRNVDHKYYEAFLLGNRGKEDNESDMIRISLIFLFYSISIVNCIKLMYPAPSVFQVTSSFSIPIETPGRKVFVDWGLQMNYDLPSKLSQFYNVPIWPHIFEGRSARETTIQKLNTTMLTNKYRQQTRFEMHPSDFTADELYYSLENLLVRYGYHETCLLRSACELARYPIAFEQKNLLTEILSFTLSPSLHQSFSDLSSLYSNIYTEAEQLGVDDQDCSQFFSECKTDILNFITKIIS